jgi:hypothetical protein
MALPPCSPGSISKGTFRLPVERPIRPTTSCSSSQGSPVLVSPRIRRTFRSRVRQDSRTLAALASVGIGRVRQGRLAPGLDGSAVLFVAGEGRVVLVRERQVGTAQLAGDLVGMVRALAKPRQV